MSKKYVFITGASRGIGRAAALCFASAGWHVFLNCHRSIAELEKVRSEIDADTAGSCTLVPGDVGNPEEVDRIFRRIYQSCSCLDLLVNNAGISHIGLITDMKNEEWNHMLRTNLSSVFYCSKAALPPMIYRKQGRIINISSIWGTAGASCEAAYSAAKSGIHGLTRAMAKELAPSNIQINAIACGVIDTAMNSHLSSEERAALEEAIPAGRFGTVQEAARLIFQLAESPMYMTGQVIGIDGGFL